MADFSLSVALGSHIWQLRSEFPGYAPLALSTVYVYLRRSHRPILNRLIRAVLISGLPCTIAALIGLICIAALPMYNMTCIIFNLAMAKLYVVSCLYTLNCRNELREEWGADQEIVDLDLDDIRFKVRPLTVSHPVTGHD
jgi:hypothetical protein